GCFAASLDADTEGVEGLTYSWTPAQLREVLGDEDGQWAAQLLLVTERGNFENRTSTLRMPAEPLDGQRWQRIRGELAAARAARPQPACDDKVVAEWNGLAITALVEAGRALDDPQWIDAARSCANFLLEHHVEAGRLRRTSRRGELGATAGVLADYGCLAEGLLALYQADPHPRFLAAAQNLLDVAVRRFAGEQGSYFDTADDAETLVRRPADQTDNATPSGASALAAALLSAAALVGPDEQGGSQRASRYRELAELAVTRVGVLLAKVPRFAGNWCAVAEAIAAGPVQVAIVGPHGDAGRAELTRAAVAATAGGAVLLAGEPESAEIPLLADRPLLHGAAAAYVCRGYVCDRPVSSAKELVAALRTGATAVNS
ncbi:MAG: N-acylglucosamine 2-epimerase, partial [Sciscionella sp.]